jgi:hypothetical protein
MTGASAASAQSLTEAQARAIIAPWYSLFNVANRVHRPSYALSRTSTPIEPFHYFVSAQSVTKQPSKRKT